MVQFGLYLYLCGPAHRVGRGRFMPVQPPKPRSSLSRWKWTIGCPVQAARVHLSDQRDLRRHQRLLGLRPAGRRAEAEHQGRLVARHGHRATTSWSSPAGAPSTYDMVGLDCSIIMHPQVWKCSGHYDLFHDKMQTCRQCKKLVSQPIMSGTCSETASGSSPSQSGHVARGRSTTCVSVDGPSLCTGRRRRARSSPRVWRWCGNPRGDAVVAGRGRPSGQWRPIGMPTFLQYLATEQLAQTGLAAPCPSCGGDLTEPREFNLMFETYHRRAQRRGKARRSSAPRPPRASSSTSRTSCDTTRVQGALRHRPDRQELPQRDHAAELHLPLARVRADGDRVLLPPERVAQVVRVLARPPHQVVHRTSAWPASSCGCASTTRTSCPTTRAARATSSTPSRSWPRATSASSRASPIAATSTCAATWKASWSTRTASWWSTPAPDGKPK